MLEWLMAGKFSISGKITCIFDLQIPLLGICLKPTLAKIRKKVCMKAFIITFFILSKDWKRTTSPSIGE